MISKVHGTEPQQQSLEQKWWSGLQCLNKWAETQMWVYEKQLSTQKDIQNEKKVVFTFHLILMAVKGVTVRVYHLLSKYSCTPNVFMDVHTEPQSLQWIASVPQLSSEAFKCGIRARMRRKLNPFGGVFPIFFPLRKIIFFSGPVFSVLYLSNYIILIKSLS